MCVVTLVNSLKLLAMISLLFALRNCDSNYFHNFLWLLLLISDWFSLPRSLSKNSVPSKSRQLHYTVFFHESTPQESLVKFLLWILCCTVQIAVKEDAVFQVSENPYHSLSKNGNAIISIYDHFKSRTPVWDMIHWLKGNHQMSDALFLTACVMTSHRWVFLNDSSRGSNLKTFPWIQQKEKGVLPQNVSIWIKNNYWTITVARKLRISSNQITMAGKLRHDFLKRNQAAFTRSADGSCIGPN